MARQQLAKHMHERGHISRLEARRPNAVRCIRITRAPRRMQQVPVRLAPRRKPSTNAPRNAIRYWRSVPSGLLRPHSRMMHRIAQSARQFMRKMNGLKNSNAHSIFRNSSQNSFMINCSTFDENSEILWHMAHSEKDGKAFNFHSGAGAVTGVASPSRRSQDLHDW